MISNKAAICVKLLQLRRKKFSFIIIIRWIRLIISYESEISDLVRVWSRARLVYS